MSNNFHTGWGREFAFKIMRIAGLDTENLPNVGIDKYLSDQGWTQLGDFMIWDPDTLENQGFPERLAKAADEVAADLDFANLDGEELEDTRFVSGRIGNVSFACEVSINAFDRLETVLSFEAACLHTKERAAAQAVLRAQSVTNRVARSYGRGLMDLARDNKALKRSHAINMVMRAVKSARNEDESSALEQWLHVHDAEIVAYLKQRIVDGDLCIEDIPRCFVNYGLMDPVAFRDEMLERMGDPD